MATGVTVDIVLTAELVGTAVEEPPAAPTTSAHVPAAIPLAPLTAIPVVEGPAALVVARHFDADDLPRGERWRRTLWHVRRAMSAAAMSSLVHVALLIGLGYLAAGDVLSIPPPWLDERPVLEASIGRIEPPEAKVFPVVTPLVVSPKAAESRQSAAAHGMGSAGSGGGRGGGSLGGTQIAGLQIGPVRTLRSGGTGIGTDNAYGGDMLGSAGEPVPSGATFFGVKAQGKNFAFVVDTSGSMFEGSRYMRCRRELIESISALKYGQKYYIVFFNHALFPMPERKLVEARPEQVRKTINWLSGAVPSGGTVPWPGVLEALKLKPDAIYLLTDGNFDADILEKVAAYNPSKKIPIHTIAFESIAGEPLLKTIARITDGTYRYVP